MDSRPQDLSLIHIYSVILNEKTQETVLENGIYTNNAVVTAKINNAGGIIGNADKRYSSPDDEEDAERRGTARKYSDDPADIEVYVDSNHFEVSDVYNIGKVTAEAGFNAGGIFGMAGAGSYYNTPELVKKFATKHVR